MPKRIKRYTAQVRVTKYYELNFNSNNFDAAMKKAEKLLPHLSFEARSPVETIGPTVEEVYVHLDKREHDDVNGIVEEDYDDYPPEFNGDGSEVINWHTTLGAS